MITYITGVPGSGKSLRAMWWLTQDEYKDRPIYSNMEGERSELPKGHACLPVDWQDCPDGSVIVIDECQHRWPQRGPGSKTPPEEAALDTHRHRGVDFILMTQRPTGVSHHVRGLVGKHEHLKRKAGAQMSFLQASGEAFNPKDWNETKHLDSKLWRFPKDLYGQYKSSIEHTGAYKFRMPMKAKAFSVVLFVLFSVVGVLGWHAYKGYAAELHRPVQAATPRRPARVPSAPSQLAVVQVPAHHQPSYDNVSGCIASPDDCRCFDYNLRPIPGISDVACHRLIENLPYYSTRSDTAPQPSPHPSITSPFGGQPAA